MEQQQQSTSTSSMGDNNNNSNNTTIPSLGHSLPMELVLQFLTLKECLNYTLVSIESLEEMLPELDRRRTIQFLCRHMEEGMLVKADEDSVGYNIEEGMLVKGYKLPRIVRLTPIHSLCQPPDNSPSYPVNSAVVVPNGNINTKDNEDLTDATFLQPVPDLHNLGQEEKVSCLIPSVKERVESLYRAIPQSHPFKEDLRTMVLDLKQQRDQPSFTNTRMDDESPAAAVTSISAAVAVVGQLIESLRAVMTPHRLHASLLARSTTHLTPIQSNSRNNTNPDDEVTVTLDHYMGDVLTAYYLSGHSIAGIVEGGPTFLSWIDRLTEMLIDGRNSDDEAAMPPGSVEPTITGTTTTTTITRTTCSASQWYNIYVYLHSSSLRCVPYPTPMPDRHNQEEGGRGRKENFGLEPSVGYLVPHDMALQHSLFPQLAGRMDSVFPLLGGSMNSVFPPRSFLQAHVIGSMSSPDGGQIIRKALRRLFELITIRSSEVGEGGLPVGQHNTLVNNFGPLGPAFRGRDDTSIARMTVNRCLIFLQGAGNEEGSYGVDEELFSLLLGHDVVFKWMIKLQEQLKNVRPMTVLPPLTTITS